MARFKVGDKVTLSEKFYKDYPSLEKDNQWVKRLRRKVEKDGYITIAEVFDFGYRNEELDVYLPENWLEPYRDCEPSPPPCGPGYIPREVWIPCDAPAYMEEFSVRDRFAMAALTGLLSSDKDCIIIEPSTVARAAYELADAMMERRKQE